MVVAVGVTDVLPLAARVPVQPPDAVQLSGPVPVVLQVRVMAVPAATLVFDAARVTAGLTGAAVTLMVTDLV